MEKKGGNLYHCTKYDFMNFLAHLFLSPDDNDIMIGNFIADAIKGKNINTFNDDIKLGVKLHREIDNYTDNHLIFKESAYRLRDKYRLYSRVIVDIYYDHFLARQWETYANVDLISFASHAYKTLIKHYTKLPPRYKRILPFMIAQNWLVGYSSFWSLERVFKGMSRRTGYKSGMENAVTDLKKDYKAYEKEFSLFFPELINFVYHSNFNNFEDANNIIKERWTTKYKNPK